VSPTTMRNALRHEAGSLRHAADLLGSVASDSTAWRRVADLAGGELSVARLDAARRRVRANVWRHRPPSAVADEHALVCVDIDPTLVTAHSDKQDAAGTFKGGFGFHPLLGYCRAPWPPRAPRWR
jgi:hypothetical protein